MQLDFFDITDTSASVEMGECNRCKECLPRTTDYFAVKRVTVNSKSEETRWLSNTCRRCESKGQKIANSLRSANIKHRTDFCDCCGKKTDKLRLDHDHITEQFRGWLCDNCNTGIGRLGDNIEGVKKAIAYLEKA